MPAGDAMSKHDRPPMEELRRTLRRLQDGHHLIDFDELGHSAEELAGIMIGLSWATGEFGRSAIPMIVYDALEAIQYEKEEELWRGTDASIVRSGE